MFSAIEFIKYLLRSFHLHGVHSPFVYHLNESIFKEKTPFYSFEAIESLRAKLLLTPKEIEVLDLGAGSKKGNHKKRRISDIARLALKKPKVAQLLYRLCKEYKPKTILEIGTSFGLTTSYLSEACPYSQIITLEGSPEIANVAKVNFSKLSLNNIKQVVGNFNNTLSIELDNIDQLDFVYFDGNHQEKPTIDYFELCLKKANESSIFIFDDIYWSKGMKKAWTQIKKHPKSTITIDLFEIGIVFFKTNQQKEDFTIYH
jgi:predicted O-methyltransferase YrrM